MLLHAHQGGRWVSGDSGTLMKNLFDAVVVMEVKTRLKNLGPHSTRQWGKMTAPQMLAHCSVSGQWERLLPTRGRCPHV